MLCEEIMKRDVELVYEDQAALVAAEAMRRANIGFLPVCRRTGEVVGALTDRDLAVRLVAEDLPASTSVRNVMTRYVVACRATDDIERAEELMARHQKSRIVCLDQAGRLAGVLSLSDIAQWEPDRASDMLREVSSREASP
jgi:CBS domain-containing protein